MVAGLLAAHCTACQLCKWPLREQVPISRYCDSLPGSNFEKSGESEKAKSADFSKLGLTGYSGDKVISQRDIQRLV